MSNPSCPAKCKPTKTQSGCIYCDPRSEHYRPNNKPRPLDRGKVLECLEALKALNSNFEDCSEYHAWHTADRVVDEINSNRLDVEEG